MQDPRAEICQTDPSFHAILGVLNDPRLPIKTFTKILGKTWKLTFPGSTLTLHDLDAQIRLTPAKIRAIEADPALLGRYWSQNPTAPLRWAEMDRVAMGERERLIGLDMIRHRSLRTQENIDLFLAGDKVPDGDAWVFVSLLWQAGLPWHMVPRLYAQATALACTYATADLRTVLTSRPMIEWLASEYRFVD